MSLSDEIKIIRQKRFLSQTAFADKLNVSYTTVNRWETNRAKPNLKAMKGIKDFCEEEGIFYQPVEDEWLRSRLEDK